MINRSLRYACRPNVGRSSGFTLIEVLVATAITGIALGVLLSGIGLGHTQAFRGDMKRTAAHIGERLLRELAQDPEGLSDGGGDIKEYPGWSYTTELRDLIVTVKLPLQEEYLDKNQEQEERELELPEFKAMILRIIPPDDSPAFVLTSIVPSGEPSGVIQSDAQSDSTTSKERSGVTRSERQSETIPFKKR